MGRPMGSKWCWTSSNDTIAPGEEGTVVGYLQDDKKVEVKFSTVTERLAPDQLITFQTWQERAVCVTFYELKSALLF